MREHNIYCTYTVFYAISIAKAGLNVSKNMIYWLYYYSKPIDPTCNTSNSILLSGLLIHTSIVYILYFLPHTFYF